MASVREQPVLLGTWQSMVGVISSASPDGGALDRPAVVILNSGVIHRVGANRMHVYLARALALRGHTVLRFDLSGIGDSEPRRDALAPFDAAMADIREVLDHLGQTKGIRRVILVGLCTGANHALLYAAGDPRVVGVALLDLYLPHTFGYFVRMYGRRFLRSEGWLNIIRGRHPMWRALRARLALTQMGSELEPPGPARAEVQATLDRAFRPILAREAQVLCVFTAGLEEQHNYRGQLLDALPDVPFGNLLRLEYFADSDHTFSSGRNRARIMELVLEWIGASKFPDAPRAPARLETRS
jgi:pimeloyl-ACP methyl ester carboxylesterase